MEPAGGDHIGAEPRRRGLLARIGVSLLNLLGAGLGLLRIGERRLALIALACSLGFPALLLLIYKLGPELRFPFYAAILLGAALYLLLVGLGSIILTFRRARLIAAPQDRWARWPVVLGATIVSLAWSVVIGDALEDSYRNFKIPSESMQPTLRPGDRLVAKMGIPDPLRRGTLLIVKKDEHDYVERVIGLPGEKLSLIDGVVHIDGKPIPTRIEASPPSTPGCERWQQATRVREIPADAPSGYLTLDCDVTASDYHPAIRIPAGHYFMMGDNRDRSADSRHRKVEGGLEMVPRDDIVGRPLFLFWSADRERIGTTLR